MATLRVSLPPPLYLKLLRYSLDQDRNVAVQAERLLRECVEALPDLPDPPVPDWARLPPGGGPDPLEPPPRARRTPAGSATSASTAAPGGTRRCWSTATGWS